MKIAVVILNWNGVKLLKEFLPSVVKYSGDNPVYVIDNNSDDSSVDFIKKDYPNINIIINTKNYGYAKGYNIGLKQVYEEVYCLLNNDVEVSKGWLNPFLEEFEFDKSLVVAQPKILDYKNKNKFEHAGAAGGFIDYYGYPYCRGRIFNAIENDIGQYDQNIDIFWASGACFFIKREIYVKLGGFDENFYNHMEEIDLCWRITNFNSNLKKKFIYKSTVYHLGGGSLSYDSPKKVFYNIRNHRWMIIKNTNFNLSLYVIVFINFCLAFYYIFKFQHFKQVIKALNYNYKNWSRTPLEINHFISRSNNKLPKYYTIKSIIFNYIILKKRKFLELNKS
ncbi:MAG: glycosyltransferase family 2 protein [Bacteroidetes bacterium]|nr:glycosyltransferase family 2 protein [Bacteroidota bacterium]